MNARKLVVLALALVGLGFSSPAYAYLDPAAGSLLLQVILGGLAGLGLFMKLFWRRLMGLLRLGRHRSEELDH